MLKESPCPNEWFVFFDNSFTLSDCFPSTFFEIVYCRIWWWEIISHVPMELIEKICSITSVYTIYPHGKWWSSTICESCFFIERIHSCCELWIWKQVRMGKIGMSRGGFASIWWCCGFFWFIELVFSIVKLYKKFSWMCISFVQNKATFCLDNQETGNYSWSKDLIWIGSHILCRLGGFIILSQKIFWLGLKWMLEARFQYTACLHVLHSRYLH